MLRFAKARLVVSVLCFVLIVHSSKCQPVHLRFKNYSMSSGLSANDCVPVYRDSRGFIWVGTGNGLNRFDGISFQNFYHNSSDSNSLPGNVITTITEMHNGLLIIGTNDGLSAWNLYKNRFENYRLKQKKIVAEKKAYIRNVFCDAGNNLWVNYNGIMDVYDSLLNYKFRFTDTPHGKILKGIIISTDYTIADENENLWIPSDNMGIVRIESGTGKVMCYKNSSDSLYYKSAIRGFYLDTLKKIVWFSPWGEGLCKYDLAIKKFARYTFPASNISFHYSYNTFNGIVPVGDKLLCASETGGVFYFNPADATIKIHTHDIYDPSSIAPGAIARMYADHEKNLWITTSTGLSKASLITTPFRYFSDEFRNNINEPFAQLLSFALYDAEWMLAGTESNGLFALNTLTGEVKQCINKKPQHENENVVTRLWIDKDKNIWAGTFGGLFLYNIEKNILTRPAGVPGNLPQHEVSAIFQDSYSDYWFSFRDSMNLVRYSARENKINSYFYHPEKTKPGFPISFASKIKEDRDGNIWFSTPLPEGFVLWNRAANVFTSYPKGRFKEEQFSESISDILPDTGNIVWLASSNGHGLMRYNFVTGNTESFSRQEGLCNEIVKSITRDGNGNLWLGTQNGLAVFNPIERKFTNFNVADGLYDNFFMRASFFDVSSNLVYLLTPQAMVYFNPGEIKKETALQKIYIQKIQINGKDTSADVSHLLQLSYNQNYINIEYTCVNFKDGSKTKFYYFLEGLDKDWTEAGSKRFASYSNLAPGNYVFRLKASVGNNDSDSGINAFTFTILPPFWKTWWFRLLIIAFIISCIYLIVVRRIRKIRQEEKQKTAFNKQLAEVEMKALRAQMNPHFIFNSLNSIHRFILSSDTEKASHYLTTFSRLIRLILENSEKKSIPLENEIELLNNYLLLEENRFKTKFEYAIHVEDAIDQQKTEIPSMLIQPYIENAIWHGLLHKETKGELKISFTKNGKGIECVIEDNGIGREKAMMQKQQTVVRQKSMAMKVTQERLNLLGTLYPDKPAVTVIDLKNKDGDAVGTRVEIHIPVEE